jgi:hypothetical protein
MGSSILTLLYGDLISNSMLFAMKSWHHFSPHKNLPDFVLWMLASMGNGYETFATQLIECMQYKNRGKEGV